MVWMSLSDYYLVHCEIHCHYLMLVMGSNEHFLSQLLKDEILRYHGILPYNNFYILINREIYSCHHAIIEQM